MSEPKVTIALLGTTPLYKKVNLEAILEIFESSERTAPLQWGLGERDTDDYDHDAVVKRIDRTGGKPLEETLLYLKRPKALAYTAELVLDNRPAVYVTYDKATPKDYADIFALGERLADVFHPDWGAVHVWLGMVDEPRGDDDRDAQMMFSAAALHPVDYFEQGPLGLAMRTYIGPHYAKQFGVPRIEKLPAEVENKKWGYRIDLVREPWSKGLKTLLPPWRTAMKALGESQLLPTPRFNKTGHMVEAEKADDLEIGSQIED